MASSVLVSRCALRRVGRRRHMGRSRGWLETLERRCLLAAAPVAVNDSFTIDEDTALFADDPGTSWSVALQRSLPLHWWDFEETSGGMLHDAGSARVDAVLGGGVVLGEAGLVGKAAHFDGTGFARIGEPLLTTDWTVETIAMVDADRVVADALLGASPDEAAAGQGVNLRLDQYHNSGEIGVTLYGSTDWRLGVPSPTEFTHVAWVGDAHGITLYVNGVHAAYLAQSLPLGRFVIGAGGLIDTPPRANDAMFGWIDELAIYDRALGAEEIATHYQAMDDTTGTVVRLPSGVLENDSDADGDPLTVHLVTPPAHGKLTLNANGGVRYVPDPDFHGTDQFTYRANDGTQDSNVATVTIHVNSVNDLPVAAEDRQYEVRMDSSLSVSAERGVLVNDHDIDGDALSAVLVKPPIKGTVELRPDGSFVYTPREGAIGRDSFLYQASDGTGLSNVAQVSLWLVRGEPSVGAVNDHYTLTEDGVLEITTAPWLSTITIPLKVQSLAYDPAGDRLFATISPGGGPRAGTLTEINPYTGELGQSIPLPSYLGDVVISDDGSTLFVVVDDGVGVQMIDLSTMTLTKKIVTAPSSAGHMLAVPGESDAIALVTWDRSISQPVGTYIYQDGERLPGPGSGTALAFDETGERMFGYENWLSSNYFWEHEVNEQGLLVTREYPWGSMLSGSVDGYQYANGRLFVTGYAGGIIDVASQRHIGTFEGGWVFKAVPSENTLYTYDDMNRRFNTYDLATLDKQNTVPVRGLGDLRHVMTRFGNDGLVVYSENTVTMVRSDELFGITRRGVLRNDNLAGTSAPEVSLANDVSHGTLELFPDGTFTYQPEADYFGDDQFVYAFVDEQGERHTGTVRLTVSAVNDLPQATDDQYVLPTSGPLVVTVAQGVLANDFDLETSDSLAAVLVDRPKHGTLQFSANGSFTYTPLDSFLLEDRFTYQASDGLGRSETQTVVIRLNVPSVEVGSHTLRANTPNQRIDLFVSGGQLVAGLDLYAQVGDGGPERTMLGLAAGQDGPAITHVELKQGTIFSNVPDAVTNLGSLPQVASWSVSLADGGSVAADGLLATLIVDTTGFFDGTWDLRLQNVLPDYDLGPLDSRFASMLAFITNGSIEIVPARVLNRQVFYNHSAWDGNDPLANASDDQAIASNKQALLPGQTASFANYTSYSRGLNGIMVDIAGLPADWEPSPADFELRVGRVGNVSSWTTAPAPTFSLRRAAGVEGSDRVTLTWPDHAIQNAWLEVRVKAGERTLLGRDDLFYFGNAMGETGTTPGNSFVTSIDVIGTRDHQRGPFDLAPIDDVYDFNRDRIVSSSDVILARDHQSGALNSLPLITVPDPANALAMLPMLTSAPSQSVVGQPRVMGDVNHDGRFDSADLVMVFQQGKYGTAQDAVWADGDWDGDGDFDHEDLIAAFQASDSKPSRRVQ